MGLTIGLGDIATRLKRSLALRGRIPSQLDETVVSTIQLFDATDPLYAQNPAFWAGGAAFAADGANKGGVEIFNGTPNLITIIDEILFVGGSVGSGPIMYLRRGQGSTLPTQSFTIVRTNTQSPVAAPPNTILRVGITAGAPATSILFGTMALQVSGNILVRPKVVLYPQDGLVIVTGTVAATDVVNLALITGREFSSV